MLNKISITLTLSITIFSLNAFAQSNQQSNQASSTTTSASVSTMKKVADSIENTGKVPAGFYIKENAKKPELLNTPMGKRLDVLTREKIVDWKDLVLNSGEYDNLTPAQKDFALKNPAKYLEVDYLLEVSEVTAVYKRGKLVGYIITVLDHVQAAIYQDGAWITFFIDAKINIADEIEGSA